MPLLNATASTANTVYQVSLIALLIGAGLVLVSAIALIWSNTIRERAMTEQLANLSKVNAETNAELLKAKSEVVEADREVVAAQAAVTNVKKEISDAHPGSAAKTVIPGRQVTVQNCGLFINFVKTVSKGRVVIQAISSNAEAIQFAGQISDMLKSAGYDVENNYGSTTLLGDQPVGVQMKIRSMGEQPVYAVSLQRGLEFIGIDTSGALDPAAADSVILFVGSKP